MGSRHFVLRFQLIARSLVIGILGFAFGLPTGWAQDAAQADTSGQLGGMSTGGAHAPVKDALSRPITAGGFVDGAPVVFTDITHTAGLVE